MKRIFSLLSMMILLVACVLSAVSCGDDADTTTTDDSADVPVYSTAAPDGVTHTVILKVKGYEGEVIIDLYEKYTPITVANFVSLVQSGFYDGLTFHRIISGFMIQGGDPEGTGNGGSPNTIKGEFSSNNVTNPLKHERGVISMARSNDPDSASSQFFIVHETSSHLDGDYAAFGRVVSGMDVIDAIAAVSTDSDDRPLTPVVIESIIYLGRTIGNQ